LERRVRFGLVHIPVAFPAEQSEELFTMLDKRDLQPVGYKRYNKTTGDRFLRGHRQGLRGEDRLPVTLEKEDFKRANVVAADRRHRGLHRCEGDPPSPESPYYLAPRTATRATRCCAKCSSAPAVAIATVVIRTRQHIAVPYPRDNVLVLNTLRYANELRPPRPRRPQGPEGRGMQPEIKMADGLIGDCR
jgi:DNA end-binding protein Ku